MKALRIIAFLAVAAARVVADETPPPLEQHRDGAAKLADDQDELSADVQQLVLEQTVPQVIELLEEVEKIMDEATDRLAEADTGGETIAAQTEIIEKIHAAAKQRQSASGSGQAGGAMMDMLERMMGKQPQGGGKKPGDQPGDQAGQGAGGESDSPSETAAGGDGTGQREIRRVPKAAGSAGREIPGEFKQAFDAYNRGMERKLK